MIDKLLSEAYNQVIQPLQGKGKFVPMNKLKKRKQYFADELCKIWKQETIAEENKIQDKQIYMYPVTIAYFLYCCPVQLIAVIKEVDKIQEYWDFFLEEYPAIKFHGNIEEFYSAVKKMRKKFY